MKRIYLTTLIIFVALSSFTGRVIRVLDGDTIEVLTDDKKTVRIRLNGIDCPEKNQDFGNVAKEFTSKMVFGKEVEVDSIGTDRYGRTIANIICGSINLNQELVKNGLAWHYVKYSKDQVLAKLEVEARDAKLGLWSMPNPIAPWDFRHK
ncbi:MAG TPA: thermonuclease family protein [Cytophagaceae bacterium]|jgi:endonuclease YncB( thermonuclease family)